MKTYFALISTVLILWINTNAQDSGLFIDTRDGLTYKWVKIGNQVWMAENLKHKPESGNYWANPKYESYVSTYGYLYSWTTACDVCPNGWHLPSDAEWKKLTHYLGKSVAGDKMKEKGNTHWKIFKKNKRTTNSSRFSALPGGLRYPNGGFKFVTEKAFFWSSTLYNNNNAWCLEFGYQVGIAYHTYIGNTIGISVRCLQDNTDYKIMKELNGKD